MGSALVLLHGFTQTGRSWDGVRRSLGPGPYSEVLAPDLRGHGEAARARPVSFAAALADLADLLPPRFSLAGYSMGGRLALLFALACPERVERLVLLGATAGIEDAEERAARRAADEARAARLETGGVEAFAEEWGALPLWEGQSPEVAAAARAERLRQDPAGLVAALRGLGTGVMVPVWSSLGSLPMPVTALAGERDAKFRALADRLAAAAPRGRAEVIRGAGHAAHLEAPVAVAAALRPSSGE